MKRVIGLMLVCVCVGNGQIVKHTWNNGNYQNLSEYLSKYSTNQGLSGSDTLIQLKNKTYALSQVDTTEVVPIQNFKTILVDVTTKDSISLLIGYRVSHDGISWGDVTTKDSLAFVGTTGVGFKDVDFTSTLGGFPFARFVFTVQAWKLGLSTPTYSARITLKKY